MAFIQVSKRNRSYEKIAVRVEDIIRAEENSFHTTLYVDNHCGGVDTIECWESYSAIRDEMFGDD